MIKKLVDAGMKYQHPSERWASTPLLVLKPGPAKLTFTVDLRNVNRFTITHN